MHIRRIATVLLALAMSATVAGAKQRQTQKICIFGMAASFTDTIVHFTPIQELDSVWMDKKKRFLLGREEYSYQLRDYLSAQLTMPRRTCVVVYGLKRKKVEKKYARMMRLYGRPAKNGHRYDVRHIDGTDFRFHAVDMSASLEQMEQEYAERKAAMKSGKKGKDRKGDGKGMPHGRRPPRE